MLGRLRLRTRVRRLTGDERGATLVEFAIVATPMLMTFFGLIDLGFRQYMASMLQGAMDQAARQVTVGGVTPATVNSFVNTRMKLVLPGSTTVVVPQSYGNFSRVGKPEPITKDTAPLGTYNVGDCFTDLNGNGRWDADGGKSGADADAIGTGDDIIYYTATSTYPTIMPMRALLGWGPTEQVKATIMVRNQPFSTQAQPATVCT